MRPFMLSVLLGLFGSVCASADVISVAGNLAANDPNEVFLWQFAVHAPGGITLQSLGYGGGVNASGTAVPAGGFDAYITVFRGSGPEAEFVAADDDSGCPPGIPEAGNCRDPRLGMAGLAAGVYTLALTTFGNISFAENYGGGTLGDGFVLLGSFDDPQTGVSREPSFAFDLSGDVAAVPEPRFPAAAAVLIVLAMRAGRRVRRAPAPPCTAAPGRL